jgi:hypothetical protein
LGMYSMAEILERPIRGLSFFFWSTLRVEVVQDTSHACCMNDVMRWKVRSVRTGRDGERFSFRLRILEACFCFAVRVSEYL